MLNTVNFLAGYNYPRRSIRNEFHEEIRKVIGVKNNDGFSRFSGGRQRGFQTSNNADFKASPASPNRGKEDGNCYVSCRLQCPVVGWPVSAVEEWKVDCETCLVKGCEHTGEMTAQI